MKRKRPVLQDVADLVGVTKMTVDRYLRSPEQVPEALRGKIAVTLDEPGYAPNRAPDILSNATSRTTGVLLPSLTNQVFSEALRGIEDVTDALGYQTMLARYGYKSEMEEKHSKSMLSWNIDGLILTRRTHMPRTLKTTEVTSTPVAELMDSQSPRPDTVVGFDNFEAVWQMTAAIIAHDHRRVAYLGARLDERAITKWERYEQAIFDAGMMPYNMMTEQSSSYSSSIKLMCQARRECPQLDGIFYTDDDLTAGTVFKCQCLGLKTPDDMAIIGFHGHDIGQVMEPRLTNVLTPREWMRRIGAGRLLTRIRGEAITPKMLDSSFTLSPDGSI